jgi:Flp pilus assembly protein TadD
MPVTRFAVSCCRPAILVSLAICAACSSLPQQQPDNRYQRPVIASESETEPAAAPVTQLQNQALAAINEDQYPLAIDYLQRAIKIQPRNAWSWHYLADIYWRRGERERCRQMIARSQSYNVNDNRLDDANAALQAQCQ